MRYILPILVLLCGLAATDAQARSEIDLFKTLAWGTPIDTVRKYYRLVGPTDIGGNTNVYVSPDNPFGDIYGDLIFNFQGGKLTRFRVFLGDKDSGDRFRAALRVMSGATGWTQIFLKAGAVEIPLLVKPAIDPFKPPPPPPTSFADAKSVWIEGPLTDEALFTFKQKKSYRDLIRIVTAKSESLRGVVVSLRKGFVTVSFAPARDLVQELEQTSEDIVDTLQTKESESKDLDLLKPVAPK